ncbi:transcriptional regulator [Staphylococcus microti]|uniref:Accessory regulator A n=1 Tax=Staphylococcus microti TaxID=569857 RepID=A0A0D6XV53_9STAP|nr:MULTISPECIES: transcriptional regulator [Staphylococcus]KIR10467.1 transcriptional regulator [Staphylococcus gallinarum]KIX91733.1 transcriptional regulator [Staphylococcus microti]PNZ84117.1 transcriptional regulator [Staphylococcus microti]SUN02182.1 accessory regulator A [Staphylococcus microti]SUN02218.1 accessory regulator A [Staphylococcus microti]
MSMPKIENSFELLITMMHIDELKKMIKNEFHITLEEFSVLTYLNEKKASEYYLKDLINNLSYNQPRIVNAVKTLSSDGYFDKCRSTHDERMILILINDFQREKITNLLNEINVKIKSLKK